ncbi:MAG: cytochrome c [Acidobacteria bacterium]|nr:cytochrome c [Acidobacteriota bacterium]
MTTGLIVIGCALYGATTCTAVRASQDATKTTWDAVFTDAQAKRGDALYSENCAKCHAPDLTGADVAPALTGGDFTSNWSDLSVGDLFERMRIGMPADKPGSVSRQDNADILAFMLFKAGFPTGAAELPTQTEMLNQIKFVAQKK